MPIIAYDIEDSHDKSQMLDDALTYYANVCLDYQMEEDQMTKRLTALFRLKLAVAKAERQESKN
jgi:hypothetical protein